jgi:shikimate kinase
MGGNLFLVGMMGAGKTTVGKALAQRLRRRFVDTDKLLVERTGVPVRTIFELEGEAGFRRRESALLAELARDNDCVVATGGGAVLDPDNRRLMREGGTVVYLRARVDSLWERTRHDMTRPLLATPDPRATLASILEVRDPLYVDAAHLVIDTGPQGLGTIVNRVLNALQSHASGARG